MLWRELSKMEQNKDRGKQLKPDGNTITSHVWPSVLGYDTDSPDASASTHTNRVLEIKGSEFQANGRHDGVDNVNNGIAEAVFQRSGRTDGGTKEHKSSGTMPAGISENTMPNTQLELIGHSMVCVPYPYSTPYYGGIIPPAFDQQTLVHSQLLGTNPNRMALPLEMAEEPVYVNAKQYHGILRRRQLRAKAELENKLIKVRKPYLHESRHLHAMRRARGCGGRFLNTKKHDSASVNCNSPLAKCNGSGATSNASGSAESLAGHGHSMPKSVQQITMEHGLSNGISANNSYHTQHQGLRGLAFYPHLNWKMDTGDCFGQQHHRNVGKGLSHRVLTIK